MNTRNIFYAETIEGYGFKVLFEIIEKNFPLGVSAESRGIDSGIVHFKVNKNGIFIFMKNNNLIIDSSFYGKYMNEFEYTYQEEEFLFGIFLSDLIEIKKIKKKEILTLSVDRDGESMPRDSASTPSRNINIKIYNSASSHCELYNKPILGIQNYINEIPQGYCDFPINLNNSNLFISSWKKIKTNDDGVNIQLMKNTIKLSFHDTNSIIIGDATDGILYEDVFNTELITNIIKISSFGTLRIYHNKDLPFESKRPLLFSAMVGCGSGNINLYVSARSETSPDY